MAPRSPLPAAFNAGVTLLFGPGIFAHEYAHLLACRLHGVSVIEPPTLTLFDSMVTLEHEPVDRFGQDLSIAVAPFVVNSVLAITAFVLAGLLSGPFDLVTLWLGVTFGITALPSPDDTNTLVKGVGTLPSVVQPLGYLVAVPARAASVSVFLAGVLGLFWTRYLFGIVAGA